MALSPDGTRLAAAAWGGSTYLYSQHSSRERQGAPDNPAVPAPQAASAAQLAAPKADMQRTLIPPVQEGADGSGQQGSAEAKPQRAEAAHPGSGVSPHVGQAGEEGVLLELSRGSAKEPESVPVSAEHTGAAHAGDAVSRLAGIDHGLRGERCISDPWLQVR